jgi:DNA-binding CsgD family transcriptional regulator
VVHLPPEEVEHLDRLFGPSDSINAIIDPHFRFLWGNRDPRGGPMAPFIGRSVFEFYPPEFAERHRERLELASRTGESIRYDDEVVIEGVAVWATGSIHLITNSTNLFISGKMIAPGSGKPTAPKSFPEPDRQSIVELLPLLEELHARVALLRRPVSLQAPEYVSSPALRTFFATQAAQNLSEREREVLNAVIMTGQAGLAAERLSISVHTLRNHTGSIYRKLGVNSQLEMISMICRAGTETHA